MNPDFIDRFRLKDEKENLETVNRNIESGVVFRGTNLWILVFAIFVASLGLNVNSTAVIIGAMLISPLMGPIMGVGFSVGINDAALLRKSLSNYLVATFTALATSTLYFLITPLYEAHSEILARTTPTVYDVIIAFFGGLAGTMAVTSKIKGNVIPGVAIATALMPPLCTAGYGIATLKFDFFLGASYLFIINSVFIAVASFVVVRALRYPLKHQATAKSELVAKRTIYIVVIITLLPSIYFAYDLVKRNEFNNNVERFISSEAVFPNDYLLNKRVSSKERLIVLTYGGREITQEEIEKLKSRMGIYGLDGARLEIRQGFAYENNTNQLESGSDVLARQMQLQSEYELNQYRKKEDSLKNQRILEERLYSELKIFYPGLQAAIIQPVIEIRDSSSTSTGYLALLTYKGNLQKTERTKIEELLKSRLRTGNIKLIVEKPL